MKHRALGRTGVQVSEICLGTMSFGTQWGFGADLKTSHEVLDAYAAAGGNFLDTANKYPRKPGPGGRRRARGRAPAPRW